MRKLIPIALFGLTLTVVLSGSAAAKIMVKVSPRSAATGDRVKIVAGWADPVGPYRRMLIYLVAPTGGQGNGAEVTQRLGPDSRRRIVVLDSTPDKPGGLRTTFTVPKVTPGSYGVDVCGDGRHCYRFGRLRVTAPILENVVPGSNGASAVPTLAGSRTAGGPKVTTTIVGAGIALLVGLAYIVLTLRRITARRAVA